MRWPSLPWLFWAFSSSFVLHGVAYASLSFAPRHARVASLQSEVTFEVNEPPPPPLPLKEPEQEAPEEPPAKAEPKLARVEPSRPTPALRTPVATAPANEPKPSAAPLDLSGVTLTNDEGPSFGMALGNGRAFEGPIGNGRAPVAAREAAMPSQPPLSNTAPALVAAADLSQKPAPPALDAALRNNYPRDARERGIGGSARVRARVEPSGAVRQIRVESESFSGFGDACRKTLEGSRWSSPRDREGRAVATEIRYTCRFVVEP
ncbi:MAG TPA: TonB family protein [Polyangiaceae bacterium]|nr:TonB family protein [Polyangiaceae bacterium]